jgi:molybdate transport system regulatory protein
VSDIHYGGPRTVGQTRDGTTMTLRKDFETHLSVGDVTVTGRDIEMLRAIDRYGSMHRAAEELGRSYPHLQRRLVEIEDAAGDLTERSRGGEGGGGTTLTSAARDLTRQFARLRAELHGVASVTESVLTGTVTDRNGEIATVATDAGPVAALVPEDATEVEVCVRSDAVVLRDPDGATDAADTSLRNELAGTVRNVETGDAVAGITVALDGASDDETGPELVALVTETSRSSLALEPGRRVVASFKATAARGVDPTG